MNKFLAFFLQRKEAIQNGLQNESKNNDNLMDIEWKNEDLFIGNLHYENAIMHNRHTWIMFISSSPVDVVIPKYIKQVTYKLHETFRPNKIIVKDPPFYLARKGWGYFDVNATIEYINGKMEEIDHSIHFGSPICTTSFKNRLPYLVQSMPYQLEVETFAKNYHKKKAQQLRNQLNGSDNQSINDDSFTDTITKESIKQVIFEDFLYTKEGMKEELIKYFNKSIPVAVIDIIVDYSVLHSINNVDNCYVIIKNCINTQILIKSNIMNLKIFKCINMEIQFQDINRNLGLYNSKNIKLYSQFGITSSFRMLYSDSIEINSLDIFKKVVFLCLYSSNINIRMFDGYAPNAKQRDIISFDDKKKDACYIIVWRRTNMARFYYNEFNVSDSLVPAIST